MNILKDYYRILGISHYSSDKDIKKSYYRLSFKHHPDKGGDKIIFGEITEAYNALLDLKVREIYDSKSRWGRDYNEHNELFNIDFNTDYQSSKKNYENFKKNEVLTIIINVDGSFNGSMDYERWVMCKDCGGSGKDLKSKVIVRDEFGNIKGVFDSEDGCDFCEGTGKDPNGNTCGFCLGEGKVGAASCQVCQGEKRILGKQILTDIKLLDGEVRIKFMGHFSKSGEVGDLVIKSILN